MSKLIDLVGKRFGMLTVLKKVSPRGKSKGAFWETVCDCGETKVISSQCLQRGRGLHCHLHPRKGWGEARNVLAGQKFGRLSVLSLSHINPRQGSVWLCLCECGGTKEVLATSLVQGHTKSCGCLKKETMKRGNFIHGHACGSELSPQYRLWIGAKCRAKEDQIIFDLRPDDIHIPEICPLLGVPLRFGDQVATGNSPSLDRIIPSLGYTRDNAWVISKRANTIKNDASLDELKMITANLEKKINETVVQSILKEGL